jgi:multidrug efflux pump subunit AcrA (membrane-fusion protein)
MKATLVIDPTKAKPVPGMNARGQIITASKPNVLVIPPRAIRLDGDQQVVDVRRADGSVEEVPVVTGANDGSQVEVTEGLNEGDVVLVVTLTSGQAEDEADAEPTLPGGID